MFNNWLENQITSNYELIRVLKDNDDTRIIQLKHKQLNKNIIYREFIGKDDIYKMLLHINHINLPIVYEVTQKENKVIVLEEFIDGITIADILDIDLFHENGAQKIIEELCNALTVLHEKGIIHRDIKPENVMIDNDGNVKLIDFDAAKLFKFNSRNDTTEIGTVGFAAPEQYGLTQSDARSDIYALGVLLNVMLTHNHPAVKLCSGKPARIVEKCVNTFKEKRYQTVVELKRSL